MIDIENRKGYVKNYWSSILKAGVAALFVMLQFYIVFFMSYLLSGSVLAVYYVIEIAAVFTVIGLVNNSSNASFKLTWLIIIALVPIAGLIMYLLWGRELRTRKLKARNLSYIRNVDAYNVFSRDTVKEFEAQQPEHAKNVLFLENSGFPLYHCAMPQYYASGEASFDAVLEDMMKAEKFIFIDFFIVAEGVLWQRVKKVLTECVNRGVEIRFLYDDFGAMLRTDKQFWKELSDIGIKTASFNPVTKYMDKLYFNYRSHQKIIVIDGKIGYTGGFNLADEYVNCVNRFGHWKDSGVRIEGDAVYGLTATFLGMWNMASGSEEDSPLKYKRDFPEGFGRDCFAQIICDGPVNNPENPIASAIKQMIYGARKRLYITTPYLIIEDEFKEALCDAVKCGVDVRIVVPAVPDKKLTYLLTRFNYGQLLKSGVRIYEYSPGFIHAKTYLTDDFCMLGTVNFDYRSLYLHYECAAVIWNKIFTDKINEDISHVFDVSREISYEEWKSRPTGEKLAQQILNLVSVLF